MRVVLDTNILISACLKPGGNEARMLELVREETLIACVSAALIAEYHEVAARKKFDKQRASLTRAIEELLARAVRVDPVERCDACSDLDDNLLLECALAAEAAYVVTGNLADFPAEWRGVRVVNARAMFDRIP